MFNAAKKKPIRAYNGSSKRSASSSSTNTNDGSSGGPDTKGSIIKEKKSSTPPTTIEINNIEVHFPFRPYDVQRDYMEGVLTALKNSQHALLESPTGTGKTLCLLCSALAWQHQEKGRILSQKDTPQLTQQQPLHPAAATSQLGHNDDNGSSAAPPTRNPNKPPVIIYASRTHSQLSQVVGELRNTRYRPRHAVLGSREHMCIHPKVNPTVAKGRNNPAAECKSSTEVNNGCSKLCKDRKCMYKNTLEERQGKNGVWNPPSNEPLAAGREYEQPVLDMEDLVTVGKENRVCPFYHTRSLLKDAELIFVPYNYLFDRDARTTTLAEVDFENAILIFDEAHNLEEFASESSSFDLSSADIAGCVAEVQRALQFLELNPDMGDGSMKDNALRLKSLFLKFEQYLLHGITEPRTGHKLGPDGEASHPGEFIFDIFVEGAGINHENLELLVEFLKRVNEVIMEFTGNSNSSGTPKLDHFLNCLKRAFGTGKQTTLVSMARAKSYRVHVTKNVGSGNSGGGGFAGGRTISYWCFAPALAMRELSFLKVRSILITSGTLSPLPSFSMELGLDFPVQLENDHVIQSDQVFVRVVGKGVSGKELSSKYGRRDDPEYILELGNTLATLCRQIPGGVLVFFPSYSAMETAVQKWGGPASERFGGRQSGGRGAAFFAAKRKKQSSAKYVFPMVPSSFKAPTGDSSPWQRLLARKSVVLEPRSTSDLNDAIGEFKKFISRPKSTGAILMGVCRGKISEGIDFSDDMCRAVVVTGLPFAPYLDPKVKLKREFLDAARASSKARPSIDGGFGNGKLPVKVEAPSTSKTLSGAEWYNQQAHRAVNQAIGRVIRHRHDYGAVLLLDHRFAEGRNREGLSKWLRPHLRDESFGLTNRGLIQFYKDSKVKSDKAKSVYRKESQEIEQTSQKTIKYESDDDTKLSKVCLVNDDAISDGYVQQKGVIQHFDLNQQTVAASSAKISREDFNIMDDDNSTVSHSKHLPAAGLGAYYSKEKGGSQLTHPSLLSGEKNTSSFGNIERKPRANNPLRVVKKEPVVKRRPQQQSRKSSDAAKLQAKFFFEKASEALSKEDIMKVQKLLVAMRGYGESKNEQQYIKAAKELISVLVDSHVDSKRIQLIITLFPLLPIKYRYKIEKMAAILAFDKSPLSRELQSLSEQELSNIKDFIKSMIFSQSSSHDPMAITDRALLEESQKILTLLVKHEVNLQLFFDLLPERHLRRVRALAMEMKRTQDVAKARERSSNFKGEKCVNPALFRRAKQNHLSVRANQSSGNPEDVESQKNMAQSLSQAMSVNNQKKNRVINFQKKAESKPKPFNPYRRSALKDSTKRNLPSMANGIATSKRVCNGASSQSQGNTNNPLESMDIVDRCLHQANSDFVRPKTRLEQINSKIKAHVPKGLVCIICSEAPKEPLMAECHHSACISCWRSWLQRQNTCPVCRAPTQMKDLAKLVFAKDTGGGAPSLTQICASEDEEESDNEELEIVAN
ncbi:hypothetical protein ACHAXR_010584 [Thalassiosira sp. AJA248-18]